MQLIHIYISHIACSFPFHIKPPPLLFLLLLLCFLFPIWLVLSKKIDQNFLPFNTISTSCKCNLPSTPSMPTFLFTPFHLDNLLLFLPHLPLLPLLVFQNLGPSLLHHPLLSLATAPLNLHK